MGQGCSHNHIEASKVLMPAAGHMSSESRLMRALASGWSPGQPGIRFKHALHGGWLPLTLLPSKDCSTHF